MAATKIEPIKQDADQKPTGYWVLKQSIIVLAIKLEKI
jgi:hypothetical protein